MLVIHAKDRTTSMLGLLYQGLGARLVDQQTSNAELRHILNHVPRSERIMMLGHGSENGLFSREDDTSPDFDRIIVGHPHAYYLRNHGGNMVGIWCNAVDFARREGLHGLFTGMIISDKPEAESYGIITLQHIIERSNDIMFARLRGLLDEGTPLNEIPLRMQALNDSHLLVDMFNYEQFFYL